MATRTTTKPTDEEAATVIVPADDPAVKPEFVDPFADIDEAVVVTYTRADGAKIPEAFDPNKISATVRAELERSYRIGWEPRRGEILANEDGPILDDEGNPTYEELEPLKRNIFMTKKFPSPTVLAEYVKQAMEYAAYKGWTLRKYPLAPAADFATTGAYVTLTAKQIGDAKVLRFCAKPGEKWVKKN